MKEPRKCNTEGKKSFVCTISIIQSSKTCKTHSGVKNQDGVTNRLVVTRKRHKNGLWSADNFMFLNQGAGYMNVLTL